MSAAGRRRAERESRERAASESLGLPSGPALTVSRKPTWTSTLDSLNPVRSTSSPTRLLASPRRRRRAVSELADRLELVVVVGRRLAPPFDDVEDPRGGHALEVSCLKGWTGAENTGSDRRTRVLGPTARERCRPANPIRQIPPTRPTSIRV